MTDGASVFHEPELLLNRQPACPSLWLTGLKAATNELAKSPAPMSFFVADWAESSDQRTC